MDRRGAAVRGALAGSLAAVAALAVHTLAGRALGVPSLPAALEDVLTRWLPPLVLARLLSRLSFEAKPTAFVALGCAAVLAGGLGSALLAGRTPSGLASWSSIVRQILLLASGAFVVLAILLVPVEYAPNTSAVRVAGLLGLACVVFGVGAVALARLTQRRSAAVGSVRRRWLLRAVSLGVLGVGSAWLVQRLSGRGPMLDADDGLSQPVWDLPDMPPEVTPTDHFYVVSKNAVDPDIRTADWALEVTGTAERSYTLGYRELRELPTTDRYQTLECISNEVGGRLISTAHWRGVRLADLLEAARPLASTQTIVFRAEDGYSESLHIEDAERLQPLVAYAMNGTDLAPVHGGPARLLVIGAYGMKSVKWLRRIELADHPAAGYWEQRGWSNGLDVKTMSQIRTPNATHPRLSQGPATIAGVAYAGERAIQRVEVSIDAGRSWSDASLKEALSPYTWRMWRFDWRATPGQYAVLVRATDSLGQLQPSAMTDPIPDGATGWDTQPAQVM